MDFEGRICDGVVFTLQKVQVVNGSRGSQIYSFSGLQTAFLQQANRLHFLH